MKPPRRLAERLPALVLGARSWPGEIRIEGRRRKSGTALLKPDLDDIFAEHPPRLVRDTHYGVAAVIVVLIVIASYVNIDIIVSASGHLVADRPTIVVQPLQLSVVRAIKVKPGDVVHKGDVVATLDPTFTEADKGTLLAQKAALQAEIERLEAELNDTPIKLEANSPDAILQLTLYHQRQSEYRQRLRAFDEDEQRYKATIVATAINSASLAEQIEIAKQMEAMHQTLFKKQIESRTTYLDASVARMRAERDQQDAEIHLSESRHFLLSREAERQVFIDQWRSQLLDELVKARKEAKTVEEGLIKADRMSDLVALKAPEDGIVLDIGKRSVGSVLQPAEPLITLVPTDAVLIADVMIASNDVGYTKVGDEVVIKVDAFPYQRHGFLTGRLRAIGEDAAQPAGGGSAGLEGAAGGPPSGAFHRSQVELTKTDLRGLQDGSRLIPGMTLTAEIKVGTRSIMSYFLYPIMRGLDESIREP